MKRASFMAALAFVTAAAPWAWSENDADASAMEELKTAEGDGSNVQIPQVPGKKAVSPGEPSAQEVPTFEATAEETWRSNHGAELGTLGVERTAEMRALEKCQIAGLQDCVVFETTLLSCESRDGGFENTCSARATAGPGGLKKGDRVTLVKRRILWEINFGWGLITGFGPLDELGVQRHAERAALKACHSKGLAGCVVVKANHVKCNKFWRDFTLTCNSPTCINISSCEGKAIARGYPK